MAVNATAPNVTVLCPGKSSKAQGKETLAALRLPDGTVQPEPKEKFEGGMPGTREGEHSLNVLLLLHIAPQAPGAAEIQPAETAMLLSIVRHMAQEPRIGTYSVAAFNLDQNEISTVWRTLRRSISGHWVMRWINCASAPSTSRDSAGTTGAFNCSQGSFPRRCPKVTRTHLFLSDQELHRARVQ